jgi:hypothetical protein
MLCYNYNYKAHNEDLWIFYFSPYSNYFGGKIGDDYMGGACGSNEVRNSYIVQSEILKGRDHLGNLGVD